MNPRFQFSIEEEQSLVRSAKAYLSGDESCKYAYDLILISTQPLRNHIANYFKIVSGAYDHDDLSSDLIFCVVNCIRCYDSEVGCQFSSYLSTCMRKLAISLWRDKSFCMRVGYSAYSKLDESGKKALVPMYLNSKTNPTDGSCEETIADTIQDDSDFVLQYIDLSLCRFLLGKLDTDTRTLADKLFGLKNGYESSFEELSGLTGYTVSTLRTKKWGILRQLRQFAIEEGFKVQENNLVRSKKARCGTVAGYRYCKCAGCRAANAACSKINKEAASKRRKRGQLCKQV